MNARHRLVFGVEEERLAGPGEKLVGMLQQILVEGIRQGDERGQRFAAAPPHSARALPGRHHAAGETDQQTGVEPPDVDAELERRGRDHRVELAREELRLDLAALFREESGPVAGHPPRQRAVLALQPAVQELGDAARLGEDDGLLARLDERRQKVERQGVGTRLGADEEDAPRLARRSGAGDLEERLGGEELRELARILRRRRGGDDRRPRAVRPGQTQQALEDVVKMGAEEPAVDVQLVEHDPLQVREELGPVPRMREDAQVQHVGIGHQHLRRPTADRRALRRRSVAVVDLAAELVGAETRGLRQGQELAALVLSQRLQRKEKDRPPRSAGERLLEHRQLEDQRLARSGRGGDQHVLAGAGRGDRLDLVRPESLDPLRGERRGERWRWRRQELAHAGRLRGEPALGDETFPQPTAQPIERRFEAFRRGWRHASPASGRRSAPWR